MILGLLLLVFGNILIWGSDEETTQFFSGWVIGVLSISVAPSLPRVPRLALASVACVLSGFQIGFFHSPFASLAPSDPL